jgi:glutamate decarboxylase
MRKTEGFRTFLQGAARQSREVTKRMLVAAYMNTNTIVKEVSRGEHRMEYEATRWLCEEMFGYLENSSGNIVTDGTMANSLALLVARDARVIELREKMRSKDKSEAAVARIALGKKMLVLTNQYKHYSIDKECHALGLSMIKLPADGYKTDVGALGKVLEDMSRNNPEKLMRVAAVVAVAGETETAQVDNLEQIASICEKYSIRLHVDAAYGGPFILSRKGSLFQGINRADSITVDPHKMMWTPYEAGAILFKDKSKHALVQNGARYLQGSTNKGLMGPPSERNFGMSARREGSMGAGGVIATWATIKLFGKEGLAALLDHTLDMAEYAYGRVSRSSVLSPRQDLELNEFLIGLSPELANSLEKKRYNQILGWAKVYADQMLGTYISLNEDVDKFLGNTKDKLRSAWRFVVVHPYTTMDDIDQLVANLEDVVSRLMKGDSQLLADIKAIEERERDWIK